MGSVCGLTRVGWVVTIGGARKGGDDWRIVMSDEKPGLHIDLDWKKQAQEEKRKLEEAERQRAEERAAQAQAPVTPAGAGPGSPGRDPLTAGGGRAGGRGRDGARELPPAGV